MSVLDEKVGPNSYSAWIAAGDGHRGLGMGQAHPCLGVIEHLTVTAHNGDPRHA